ncbi:hypothetical protein LDL08_07870 [Nonomuraea glycinis]|uniref:Uncharacterized protein n=1 Tax=Nonomuraea glycinis TaxID=2047744 RepID=A0A918E9Y7_9ACTN|nr:hypothetical protein [Nonomuraea glycinis]MCA2176094.1 hypothetical protein [Nonomuraea glycinis]GGP17949.1 hypothetical protein GCM10012278_88340 [Nonomuraea glycinis]
MYIAAATDSVSIAPSWPRAAAAEIRRLGEVPAANVGDALQRMTVMDGGIRLFTGRAALLGTALTVDVRSGDNLPSTERSTKPDRATSWSSMDTAT